MKSAIKSALGAIKKKAEFAYLQGDRACSHLTSSVESRLPSPLARDERGLFGLSGIFIAIILVAIFGVTLGMMGALEWIVKTIAQGVHLTAILVHVPQIEVSGMMLPTAWPGGALPPFLQAASSAGGSLYSTFQMISVAVLSVGFVTIGLSYVLEQINVMQQGMAEKLLSESVLVLILIIIFPYLFNIGAVALNATNEGMLLSPTVPADADSNYHRSEGAQLSPKDVTNDIATAAGTAPGGAIPDIGLGVIGDFLHQASPDRAITVLVTMAASFMAVMVAFATGVFKIIATVSLAAAFPLILAMRLVPFLRSISQRLMNGLIGLMLASIVIALFFRVGWEILVVVWSNFTFRWAIGVALLMAGAGAFTITAPAMSGMSSEISGTLGRSTAGAIGGVVATGGTAALGGMAGAARAGMGGIAEHRAMGSPSVGKGELAAGMGKGFGRGMAGGAPGKDMVGSMKGGWGGGEEVVSGMVRDRARGRGVVGQEPRNFHAAATNLENQIENVPEDEENLLQEAQDGRMRAKSIGAMDEDEAIDDYLRAGGKETSTKEREEIDMTGGDAKEGLRALQAHAKDTKVDQDRLDEYSDEVSEEDIRHAAFNRIFE